MSGGVDDLILEIARLEKQFADADGKKLEAMRGLIEQAAYERLYLRELNAQALRSGLVKIHPDNPRLQKSLPVSSEITKHSATLTNIIDKLCRHLTASQEDEDDALAEFE